GVLSSNADDPIHKALAANLLIDVYSKLNRPVDQLSAAFQAASLEGSDDFRDVSPVYGISLDLAYLLDVQLSDADLEQYLMKRPNANLPDVFPEPRLGLTPTEVVKYALGVRHARHEEYTQALQSVASLSPTTLTESWKTAAKLFANTQR